MVQSINDIEIRQAVATDATGIAIVAAYTWLTAYKGLMPDSVLDSRVEALPANADRINGLIKNGRSDYVVAVYNGAVVGFASFGDCRNPDFTGGEINALYVLKGFAGKGIGRGLFEYATARLKEKGHKSMIINCLDGNPSLEFYKHMGGVVNGQRQDDVFGHTIKENILQFEI